MLQSILSNLAIILLFHLSMSMVMNHKKKIPNSLIQLTMIIVGSVAVISMFYLPIRFNHYWVDMRMIPLVFIAYIHGWKKALPTLLVASVWRFFMGGAGMVPGILFGMIGPTLIALAFHHRSIFNKNFIEGIGIIIVCWLFSDLPIIYIIPNGWEIFKSTALIRGSSFVITATILYMFITQDRQRRMLNEELEKLATEDPLTNLFNKRKFYEVVHRKITTLQPKHFLAMLDIDHFKQINDTHGHLVGDKILVLLSNILMRYRNERVTIGRYGGEEFIIYIGNSTNDEAKELIEEIIQEIRSTSFPISNSKTIHITVSIGLTEMNDHLSLLSNVNQADQNLYMAKRKGRDCLICR
ncbi:diguanylate cyclase [Ureibacillus composti]|nr:diguanylate cyclase [Ureibacillus composti]